MIVKLGGTFQDSLLVRCRRACPPFSHPVWRIFKTPFHACAIRLLPMGRSFEVHERSVEGDFLLLLLRELQKRRPELRVIAMRLGESAPLFFSQNHSPFCSPCLSRGAPSKAKCQRRGFPVAITGGSGLKMALNRRIPLFTHHERFQLHCPRHCQQSKVSKWGTTFCNCNAGCVSAGPTVLLNKLTLISLQTGPGGWFSPGLPEGLATLLGVPMCSK